MKEIKKSSRTLEEMKNLVDIGIHNVKDGFVEVGYFLKCIRDEKLWGEKYNSFDEFMDDNYAKDKSWASRCINLYEQFGVAVGPTKTPRLDERYTDYNISQLIEMLSMPPEQRIQITPEMKVKEIREMKPKRKKPESEKVATVATPDKQEPEPKATIPEPIPDEIVVDTNTCPPDRGSCRRQEWGTTPEEQKEGHKECVKCWADWKEQSKTPMSRELRNVSMAEIDPLSEPDESFNIGDLPQAREKYLRELARILVKKMGYQLRTAPGEFGKPSDRTVTDHIKRLDYQQGGAISLDGNIKVYVCAELIEFFNGDEDLGISTYTRFATQVRKVINEEEQKTAVCKEIDKPDEEYTTDYLFDDDNAVPEEIKPEKSELTDTQIAREELEKAQDLLNKCLKAIPDKNDIDIRRLKTKVAALASFVCDLDNIENPPPKPVQPVQSELPPLKNNDQRAAFVDAYETWPLWIETKETGERYYRYDLEDGTSIVVKVYRAMLFDYNATALKYGERFSEGYGRHEYYLLQPEKFFRNCETNRSALLDKLKEIQKTKKG